MHQFRRATILLIPVVAMLLAASAYAQKTAAKPSATDQLKRDATAGKAEAQYQLGDLYLKGDSVPQDFQQAYNWFLKAAAQNYAPAEYELATMFLRGMGVRQDQAEAMRWCRLAAEHGDKHAQTTVGLDLLQRQNYAEAARYFRMAARQGEEMARTQLNEMYDAHQISQQAANWLAPEPTNLGAAAGIMVENVDQPTPLKFSNPHSYALVIGAENYEPPVPPVPYALNDAKVMAAYLTARLGVPGANIKALENPTYARLKNGFTWLQNQLTADASPDPVAFIYYAGHGVPEAETQSAYLLPTDADPNYLSNNAFSLNEITNTFSKLRGKTIVMLDACFTGIGRDGKSLTGKRPAFVDVNIPKGVLFLTAAGNKQTSNPLPSAEHGLFTYYLLSGLSGKAADAKGAITLRGLFDYVRTEVAATAKRMNQEQTPTISAGAEAMPDIRLVPPVK
jgi:hypothetical protein